MSSGASPSARTAWWSAEGYSSTVNLFLSCIAPGNHRQMMKVTLSRQAIWHSFHQHLQTLLLAVTDKTIEVPTIIIILQQLHRLVSAFAYGHRAAINGFLQALELAPSV